MRRIQENSILSDWSSATYKAIDMVLDILIHYPEQEKQLYVATLNQKMNIKDDTFMLIFGENLTITFGSEGFILKSIDAYTNQTKWILEHVEIPPSTPSGLNLVNGHFDSTDRLSIESEVIYFFDLNNKVLKIVLTNAKQEKFIALGNHLIVGMSDGLPSTLIVKNIKIIKEIN